MNENKLSEEKLKEVITKCINRYYYNNIKHLINEDMRYKSKVSLFLKEVINFFAVEIFNQVCYYLDEKEDGLDSVDAKVINLIEGRISNLSIKEVNYLVKEYFKIYKSGGNFDLEFEGLTIYLNVNQFIKKLENDSISLLATSIMKDIFENRFDEIPDVGNPLSDPENIPIYIENVLRSVDVNLRKFEDYYSHEDIISSDNSSISDFIRVASTGGFTTRNRPEDNLEEVKLATKNLINSLTKEKANNLSYEEIAQLNIKFITRYYHSKYKYKITSVSSIKNKVNAFIKVVMSKFAEEIYYQVDEYKDSGELEGLDNHRDLIKLLNGDTSSYDVDEINKIVKLFFKVYNNDFDLDFGNLISYLNESLIISKLDSELNAELAKNIMKYVYVDRFDDIEYLGNSLDEPGKVLSFIVKILKSIDMLFENNSELSKTDYVFTKENEAIVEFIRVISQGGYIQVFRPKGEHINDLKPLIAKVFVSIPFKNISPLNKPADEKDNKRIERLLSLCEGNIELLRNNGIEFIKENSKTNVNYLLFKFMNTDGSFRVIIVHPQFVSSNFEGNTNVLYKKEPKSSTFKSFSEFLSSNISKIGINKSQSVVFNYALKAFDLRKALN